MIEIHHKAVARMVMLDPESMTAAEREELVSWLLRVAGTLETQIDQLRQRFKASYYATAILQEGDSDGD